MDGDAAEDATLFPTKVGEKLRGARESQGITIEEVAARTRIPQRHLEAIERSNYSGLPSTTYAMGFAKAYARAVGADEVAIARDLRGELSTSYERPAAPPPYEMDDPMRTPPRGIMWAGVLVAVIVLIGAVLFYTTGLFRGSAPPPPESLAAPDGGVAADLAPPSPAPTPVASGGQVSLIAREKVWLRINNGSGERVFEKEMAAGERYDVPSDLPSPTAVTARADQIQVTINGSNVDPLGPPATRIEVPISAAALRARGSETPAPAPSAAAAE